MKFTTDTVKKQNKNKRTYLTSSLYNFLGQNIFHKNLTAFAHDFAEEIDCFFSQALEEMYGLRDRQII